MLREHGIDAHAVPTDLFPAAQTFERVQQASGSSIRWRPYSCGPALGPAALAHLFPVMPWVTAWDGVVSCLRVYSPAELRALVASVPGQADYHWHIQHYAVALALRAAAE